MEWVEEREGGEEGGGEVCRIERTAPLLQAAYGTAQERRREAVGGLDRHALEGEWRGEK